jgi:hypothetical protein
LSPGMKHHSVLAHPWTRYFFQKIEVKYERTQRRYNMPT